MGIILTNIIGLRSGDLPKVVTLGEIGPCGCFLTTSPVCAGTFSTGA